MEADKELTQEAYDKLCAADWDLLGRKMLARALWRARTRYHLLASKQTLLPGGHSIEDIPSHIIEKAFSGERTWDHEKVDLEVWVCNQVDSVLDDWLKLKAGQEIVFEETENAETPDDPYVQLGRRIDWENARKSGPRRLEQTVEDEETARQIIETLYETLKDEPDLQLLVLAMEETGSSKSSVLAEDMDVPVTKVYTQKQRLKPYLEKSRRDSGRTR